MTNDGGIAFGVVVVIWLVMGVTVLATIGVGLWAIIDAARRPDWQFEATGQNKVLWIVLPAAGAAMCQLVTLVSGLIYLFAIRPKLNAAEPPTYRMPPPGGWPPGYGAGGLMPYAPGAYAAGTYPPGSYPPGTYPPGSYPPGSYPPGSYPPGPYPTNGPGLSPPGPYPAGGEAGSRSPDASPPGGSPGPDVSAN